MQNYNVVFNAQANYGNGAHAHVDDMLFIPILGHYAVGAEIRGLPTQRLTAEAIYLVPRRQPHSFQAAGVQEHLCYYLDAANIGGGLPERSAMWQKSTYLTSLGLVRRQLFIRSRNRTTYETTAIDDLILREVQRIFSDVTPTVAWSEAALMEAVCHFVEANLAEDLSITLIAEAFRLSERTLVRWFQLHQGMPLGRHILLSRLNRAKALLCDTRMHVAEIQACTGFDSASHFSHAFKRLFGLAPSDIRRSKDMAENR